MSASDPLQGAHGTGCPVFGLGLVTLESLTTAEHDGHGEPARAGVRNYWAKSHRLHGTILVQGLFSLSRFHVGDLYVHFRDALCEYGVHLGFGHLGHMDVSLGRGFERQVPYSWYG